MISDSNRRFILSTTKRIFNRVGLDVQSLANTLSAARRRLLDDLKIDLVLDVGANAGWYATALRSQDYRGRIASFEPLKSPFTELHALSISDPRWTAHNVALGRHVGTMPMYVSENLFSSSLLKVTNASIAASNETRIAGTEDVQVRTLDHFVTELNVHESNVLLKLDTQGFELEVLQGGEAMIEHCSAIECELSLVELYEKQPMFYEVCRYLYEKGFVMIWMERGFRNGKHELLQVDALFVSHRSNEAIPQ